MAEDSLDDPRFAHARNSGTDDSKHWMRYTYASNRELSFLLTYVVVLTILVIWLGITVFPRVTRLKPDEDLWQLQLFELVAAAGAMGGLLHVLASVGRFVGARRLLRSWLLFYYLRPIVGTFLAIGSYLVLRTGVLAPGTASASNVNVYGVLAFAWLAGLFSRQATEKLAEVFDVLFQKTKEDLSQKTASQIFGNPEQARLNERLVPSAIPPMSKFGDERAND